MIKINNLTKVYENQVVALDDITLTLPDSGMVFIVGKSGSGKSTFLNVLGSLDKATSGTIIADSIDVTKMTDYGATRYRAGYVGFVFQDYCLNEILTVGENVKLSLDINKIDNQELVSDTLKSVGLEGFENRYPKTLSAGQKQRVAIARAYIKKQKLLLCDEPTGNLDTKTAKQILDLLKELSKKTLVVIVSHNMDDAYQYADRIIEISDGKIISDLSNSSSEKAYEIRDKKLYISNINSLEEKEIESINEKIKKGEISSIHKHNELFVENTENNGDLRDIHLDYNTLSTKNKVKIASRFAKKKVVSSIITSVISATIMILLGLSQFFTSFSLAKVMEDTLTNNDQKVFALKKAVYANKKKDIDVSSLISVTDDDIEKVVTSSYQGTTYLLNNYSLPISLRSWTLPSETTISDSANLKDFYLQEIYGVLPLSQSFFNTQIFQNAEVVGTLDDKDYGIVITDYIADSILFYRSDVYSSYNDIIGTYRNNSDSIYAYINGIVKTGYKDRYQSLINDFDKYRQDPSSVDMESILLSNDYLHFYEEVKNFLGIAYSFNPNFLNDSINPLARNMVRFDNSKVSIGSLEPRYISTAWAMLDSNYSITLGENTLGISLRTFNELLSTSMTIDEASSYDGTQIHITKYRKYHSDNSYAFDMTLSIKIIDSNYFTYIVDNATFSEMRKHDVIPYTIYLDDLSTAAYAYLSLIDVPYVACSSYIDAGIQINNVVRVFSDIFVLISITLLVGVVLILTFSTYISINQRKYDIGVFKALGMRNEDISSIFVIKIIFTTILIALLFIVGLIIFTNVTNGILFNSFMSFLKNPALRAIDILSFNVAYLFLDLGLILGINLLVTIVPILVMKRIEPLKIIRVGNN